MIVFKHLSRKESQRHVNGLVSAYFKYITTLQNQRNISLSCASAPISSASPSFDSVKAAKVINDKYCHLVTEYESYGISKLQLEELVKLNGPHVYWSNLTDPYLNLALETYIFNNMPTVPTITKEKSRQRQNSNKEEEDQQQRKEREEEYMKRIPNFSHNRLVLYKNRKCIVFGKNQNPWKEINFKYLKSHSLVNTSSINNETFTHNQEFSGNGVEKFEILRRNSGGGTVIHDDGNMNYCYITTKNAFDRKTFSKVIVEELNSIYEKYNDCPTAVAADESIGSKSLGVAPKYPIIINDRGDLVIRLAQYSTTYTNKDNEDLQQPLLQEYKISGSAYKVSKGRSYHHGTMLLNCQLSKFDNILSKSGDKDNMIYDKSVDSTRAKIINLEMDEISFNNLIIAGFIKRYGFANHELLQLNRDNDNVNFCNFSASIQKENDLPVIEIDNGQDREKKSVYLTIVNDANSLPEEVLQIANELKSWDFKFGKTPKFESVIINQELNIKLSFQVEKGYITQVELVEGDADAQVLSGLAKLIQDVTDGTLPIRYIGNDIAEYFENDQIKQWIKSVVL